MYLKDLHKDFVVTTADKLSNNYVIVCKKHYVSVMQDDLQKPVESGGFYQRVPLSFNIGDHLKSQVNHLAPEAYDKAKDSELKVLKKKPYASAQVKLHKDPVTFRSLACSKGTGLQAPAKWLNHLFRGIHKDLEGVWKDLLTELRVQWVDSPPWYLTNPSQLVEVVRRFNAAKMTLADFKDGNGWQGADVARLYTNIEHDSLQTALDWVLDMAWSKRASSAVALVFEEKGFEPI